MHEVVLNLQRGDFILFDDYLALDNKHIKMIRKVTLVQYVRWAFVKTCFYTSTDIHRSNYKTGLWSSNGAMVLSSSTLGILLCANNFFTIAFKTLKETSCRNSHILEPKYTKGFWWITFHSFSKMPEFQQS